MGWNTKNFTIGGVVIEVPQALGLTQTYEEFGGVFSARMMNGAGYRQTHWTKLRTNLAGDGLVPPGVHAIDWTQPQLLQCSIPRSKTSASNVIALPSGAYRTDTGYIPTGRALVNGTWVPSPVTGGTVTTVPGAIAYMIEYIPQFTAFIDAPEVTYDRSSGKFQWSIKAEEV